MPKAKKKTKGAETNQQPPQAPFFDVSDCILPDDEDAEDAASAPDDPADQDYVPIEDDNQSSSGNSSEELRPVDKGNLDMSPEDFIEQNRSNNTKRQDNWLKNLYNDTMKSVAFNSGLNEFPPLLETSVDDLPKNLERFFMSLVTKTGEAYNPSSLNQVFACAARLLSTKFDPPIDLKSDVRFKKCSLIIKSKKEMAVKEGKSPGMNASKAVDPQLMEKAYQEGHFGRDSPKALQRTVVYIAMTGWGARPCEEGRSMNVEDLVNGPMDTDGYPLRILLNERLTKTRRGDSSRKKAPTIYKDDEYPEICAVRTICEYVERLTPEQKKPGKPFLLNLNQAAVLNPMKHKNWFSSSPMGKNNISAIFKSAFEAMGVDCKEERISAYSARKNFIQGGAESGVPANWLSLAAGHHVEQSQLNYLKVKDKTDKAMALCINRSVSGVRNKTDTDFRHVLNSTEEIPSETGQVLSEPGPSKNDHLDGQSNRMPHHQRMTSAQSQPHHVMSQQPQNMISPQPQTMMSPQPHNMMSPQPQAMMSPQPNHTMVAQPYQMMVQQTHNMMAPQAHNMMVPQTQMMAPQITNMLTQPFHMNVQQYQPQQPVMMPQTVMMPPPAMMFAQPQQQMGQNIGNGSFGYSQSMFFAPQRQPMMNVTNTRSQCGNDNSAAKSIEYHPSGGKEN